jgi:hypothetical protein
MVGGVAINLHGYQRSTGDIDDIWVEDTAENRQRLRVAFKQYGMGDFEQLLSMQFIAGYTYFHLNNGLRLDLMPTTMKGLENYSFDECYKVASIAEIGDVSVPFLHINLLIPIKKQLIVPKIN